jgi:hypothetical protein
MRESVVEAPGAALAVRASQPGGEPQLLHRR